MSTFDELKAQQEQTMKNQRPSGEKRQKCQIALLNTFLKIFNDDVNNSDPETNSIVTTDESSHFPGLYWKFDQIIFKNGNRPKMSSTTFPVECEVILNEEDIKSVVVNLQDKGFATSMKIKKEKKRDNRVRSQISIQTDYTRKYDPSSNIRLIVDRIFFRN